MTEPVGSCEWSAALVRRLRAGEASAAADLEAGLRPRLLAYARRFGSADAEDLVQEAFVRALQAATPPEDLRAWCFRVVRNLAHNRARDRGADQLWPSGLDVPRASLGPLTKMVAAEDAAEVLAQLEQLSAAQREALTLRYVEGLAREEIATVLDVSVGQVKSRLFEGLSRLRARLGADQ